MPPGLNHIHIAQVLKNVEIFKNVPVHVLDELARDVNVHRSGQDETIIHQGERGDCMYVIVSGSMRVHDNEYEIANLSAGAFFGEFSLLDELPRSLSVTAVEPSELLIISEAGFYDVLNKYPQVMHDIIRLILKRLRNQNLLIINQLREKQRELEEMVLINTAELLRKNHELERKIADLI